MHRGEKITIRGVFNDVRPFFWRYLWFVILQVLVIALIPAVIAGVVIGLLVYLTPGAGAAGAWRSAASRVLVLRVAAFGIVIWTGSGLLDWPFRLRLEKQSAWTSLQRAWSLSEGTRGRIFVLFLLILALAMAGSMIGIHRHGIVGATAGVMGYGAGLRRLQPLSLESCTFVDLICRHSCSRLLDRPRALSTTTSAFARKVSTSSG